MTRLYQESALTGDEKQLIKAATYQDQLIDRDFYAIESRINKVAYGLGIDAMGMERVIGELSGGQRTKVKLCLLLLSPCNFLILDEPTNHFDAETKEALQNELKQFKGSMILVSHEEKFYKQWTDKVLNIGNMNA